MGPFPLFDLPPVYGHFYQSFLLNRILKVPYGNTTSSWAKESSGTPQRTVSSPFLFIIYMEGVLRTIMPTTNQLGIQVAMFADDFTLWDTGYCTPSLASNLSILINDNIVPWTLSYNMT
jgi:Reverse transcriptase (RNA-dependent DNA polymerase)